MSALQMGMVGLGRMGGAMAERLRGAGHEVIGYARERSVSDVADLDELVARLQPPRVVWVMVPAGAATEEVVTRLGELLSDGDVVVDGGNSNFRDTMRRGAALAERGIELVDSGTSGGIWGLQYGYCLMIGCAEQTFERLRPIFAALAPEAGGYARVGPSGAGHFTKMIHNGIEYGLLQAYAEGFEMLDSAPHFELDVAGIAEVWRHGSVVRSWLLDLAATALKNDPKLETIRGYVQDSGEGRWTVHEAIEQSVPTPVIAASLFARFSSRQDDSYAMRLIAALRRDFGGHATAER